MPARRKLSVPDWVSLAITLVVAVVAVGAWLSQYIPAALTGRINDATKDIQTQVPYLRQGVDDLKQRVSRIETKLDAAYFEALKKLIEKSSTDKSTGAKSHLFVAQALIKNAKEHQIPFPPVMLPSLVNPLLGMSRRYDVGSAAWATTMELAEYKSSVPDFSDPNITEKHPWIIVKPKTEKGSEGIRLHLDGGSFHSIVLMNFHVIYLGGPLLLEDVIFRDCTFHVVRNNNGIKFISSILGPSSLSNIAVDASRTIKREDL